MASIKVVGSNTPKKRFFRILMVILIIGLCLLMLSPFIWMIGASLKKEADVMKQGIGLFPAYWYPENYLRVLGFAGKTNYHFLQGYWNSIKVATISAAVAGISSCLAGYAFAKLKFRGSNILFMLYLSQMMIPIPADIDSTICNFLCGWLNQHPLGTDSPQGCSGKCHLYDASGISWNL